MSKSAILPLLLKELHLPTFSRLWESFNTEALQHGWTPLHYLTTLCEHELTERNNRRLSRHMAGAELPRGKSLATFDFSAVPSLNKSQVAAFASGDLWIKNGSNLLIFGPSGVGKTHLAAAIGEQLVTAGYRVLFTRTTDLVQKLQTAKKELAL